MISKLKIGSVAVMALFASVATAANPAETEADRWNLKDMYKSQADWDKDALRVEAQFKEFAGCSGKLASSVKEFKRCMDLNSDRNWHLNTASPRHFLTWGLEAGLRACEI